MVEVVIEYLVEPKSRTGAAGGGIIFAAFGIVIVIAFSSLRTAICIRSTNERS